MVHSNRSRDVEQSVFKDGKIAAVLAPIGAEYAADELVRTAAPVVHDAQSIWSSNGTRPGDKRATLSFKKLTTLVAAVPIAKAVRAVVKPVLGSIIEGAPLPTGTFAKRDDPHGAAMTNEGAAEASRPSVVVQFNSPLEVQAGYEALVSAFGAPLEVHNLFDPEFNALRENRGLRSVTVAFRFKPTTTVLNKKHRPQIPSPAQCGFKGCVDKNLVEGQECLTTECYASGCDDHDTEHPHECHFHKNCMGVAFLQNRPCPSCGGCMDRVKPTSTALQKPAKFKEGGRTTWGQMFDSHAPGKDLEAIRADAGNVWARVKAAATSNVVRQTAVSTVFDVEIVLPAYTMLRQELELPCRIAGKRNWTDLHGEFKASE